MTNDFPLIEELLNPDSHHKISVWNCNNGYDSENIDKPALNTKESSIGPKQLRSGSRERRNQGQA